MYISSRRKYPSQKEKTEIFLMTINPFYTYLHVPDRLKSSLTGYLTCPLESGVNKIGVNCCV